MTLDAASHSYDPAEESAPYSLVFNRASPSAYRAGIASRRFTRSSGCHLERLKVPVVNGASAYGMDTSKALQHEVFEELGAPYPATRVANSPAAVMAAARRSPLSAARQGQRRRSGAGIERFDNETALAAAVAANALNFGVDGVVAGAGDGSASRRAHHTRGGPGRTSFYAINVFPAPDSLFNLCPADVCQTTDGRPLSRSACALDAPKTGMRVERADPPREILAQVERIARQVSLDVGGIEYLVDDRDGQHYFYDINALSNFVADARRSWASTHTSDSSTT